MVLVTSVFNSRTVLPPFRPDPGHARAPLVPGAVVSPTMTERTSAPVRGVSGHARVGPDRPALVMGDVVRTYGELDRRASRVASLLGARGAGPGRPVASVLPNGIEIFEVATAAAMVNAPYLPINWHLKADELAYILADADVAVVVGQATTDSELALALGDRATGVLWVGGDDEAELAAATPDPAADSGAGPELMFYTSGTTARPKGVVHLALSEDGGRVRGMEGQVALWGWTDRGRVRDERARLPRLPPRVGAVLPVRRGHHRDHRAVRGALVPGRGQPAAGDPLVHGARPLHPDPRDPRAGAGGHRRVQLLAHRARRRPLPGGRQVQDDGGVPPRRDPRALRGQRGRRHPHLSRGVAGPARERGPALARGGDPDPRREGHAGADR